MDAPVPLEDPPSVLTSLTLLELITTMKVGLCPTLRTEQPGRIPYETELDVSHLVTHAARGMAGSTSKSTRPVTASRSGGVPAVEVKMCSPTYWRFGCCRMQACV